MPTTRDAGAAIAELQAAVEAIQIPAPEVELPPLSEEGHKAAKAALRLLKVRARSRHELRRRLEDKEFEPQHVDEAMERVEAWNLLDDADFAQQWVIERAVSKGATRARLRQELAHKGVGEQDIAAALSEVSAEDERARAHELIATRLRRHESADLSDRENRLKVKRRLVAFLQRRGYSPGVAVAVVEAELKRG